MSLYNKNDEIQKWKYIITDFHLLYGDGNVDEIPVEQMRNMQIMKDYENLYFPLFKITVVFNPTYYYKMLENKNSVKIKLRIDAYYSTENRKNISNRYHFVENTFILLMDEETEDMLRGMKERENLNDYSNTVKDEKDDRTKDENPVSFYLFPDIIDNTKKNANTILSNATVTDAIAYIGTTYGIRNIIMPPATNKKIYREMLIPPFSVLKSIEFIDSYYGIFKSGAMIYYDFDYTYIIPYTGECTAYRKNEEPTCNIVVPKAMGTSDLSTIGSIKKYNSNKIFIIGDSSKIGIRNDSISNDYINANDIIMMDSFLDKIENIDSDAESRNENFITFLENITENEFYGTTIAQQNKAKSVIFTINLYDYKLMDLTPNKRFNIVFEDTNYVKKYNGSYILSNVIHTFTASGTEFALNSLATFKKVK